MTLPVKTLAAKLNRSVNSVHYQIRQLGMRRPRAFANYSALDIKILKKHYPYMVFSEFMETYMPGRNPEAVRSYAAKRLGLRPTKKVKAIGRAACILGLRKAKIKIEAPVKSLDLLVTTEGIPKWSIKVGQYNKWEPLHHYIYKKYAGPIPPDHVITYLDGDRFNNNPGNLMATTVNTVLWMTDIPDQNPDLKKAIINIQNLKQLCTR